MKNYLNYLKGRIREMQKTYSDCAAFLGISAATFSDKMNGKRKFYIEELDRLGDFLGMTSEEKGKIFL